VKMNKTTEKIKIDLRNSNKQKLILHLHKRENNGYDTKNDVYLPNAENDFSDIKITSDDGSVLPYRVKYKGELDIIADSRLTNNPNGKILSDSNNRMIATYLNYLSVSEDGGSTWQRIQALSSFVKPVAVCISKEDTLF